MNLGFPALERPARNVLIAVSHCAKIMWKAVADAMRSSARPAFSSIERSTRSPNQRIVEKGESAEVRNASERR